MKDDSVRFMYTFVLNLEVRSFWKGTSRGTSRAILQGGGAYPKFPNNLLA